MSTTKGRSLKFYKPTSESLKGEISELIGRGARRFLLIPHGERLKSLIGKFGKERKDIIFDCLHQGQMQSLALKSKEYDAVVILETEGLDRLSGFLLSCLDMTTGVVLAPLTKDHFSCRSIFIVGIPKSGTHMLIGMLEHLGIKRSFSSTPHPGRWYAVDKYSYHVPCKEVMKREWFEEIGKHPMFRSPVLFMYRNPLDIICSELSWYQKATIAFSHYFKTFEDPDEKLLRLIDDPLVLGSIRERMNRFLGWMDFSNVIPVSYEELVGPNGGGSQAEQFRTIWSLQLKLHIPGSPVEIAEGIYRKDSPTFNKGKIGYHKELFKEVHYERFSVLSQDFMEKMGYDMHNLGQPRLVEAFRQRPLQVPQLAEKELWNPRLVKESFLGYNIVSLGGQYLAVSQERGDVDLSKQSERDRCGVDGNYATLEEAMVVTLGFKISASEDRIRLLAFLRYYNSAFSFFKRCLGSIYAKIGVILSRGGNSLLFRGKYVKAISHFNRAIDIEPCNKNAWKGNGQALNRLTRYKEAIDCFNKVIDIDYVDKQGWNGKGIALNGLTRYNEALECFNRALDIEPFYKDAWINKALALEALGRQTDADRIYGIVCKKRLRRKVR